MQIKAGSTLIEVKRLLTFSGRPLIYDHIAIPAAPLKGLNAARIEENNGSMYSMYETEYGVRMIRAEERLTAIGASAEVAEALDRCAANARCWGRQRRCSATASR